MNIVFPVWTLCKGGSMRMMTELANRLALRGHHVCFVMPRGGIVEYPLQVQLVQTQDAVLHPEDIPFADVIVSNFFNTVQWAKEASDLGRGKHVRLSMCYEPIFLNNQERTFESYHATPNVIALSKFQRDLIALIHGVKSKIVPVGVSDTFRNVGIRREGDALQITAVLRKPEGGDAWHRQQTYLIEQLTHVKHSFPSVEISFISPPNELYTSPSLLALRDTGMYRFYSPADDEELCYHYNQADIFVSSSVYDAAVLPGLEAMRCGAALVAIYAGGNLDYCRHEHNCLLSYRHENRLAEQIIRLIQDPALRTRIAANGEQDSSSWTWDRSVRLFEQALLDWLS